MSNHNLDIHMYSFQDILQLFDLKDTDILTAVHMKKSKQKVLKTHPDKSGLPSQYFLFYKKAFDIIYEYFQEKNKIHRDISNEKMSYDAPLENHSNAIQNHMQTQMSMDEFQQKFNELFEKYEMGTKPKNRNTWFHSADEGHVVGAANTPLPKNAKEINVHISKLKENQRRDMVVHKDYQETQYTNHLQCYNLYNEEEDGDEEGGTVVSSDIFAKLKFEDIKRVHRDETVFSVDEKDYEKVEKFQSVEEYERKRKNCDLTPLEKNAREIEMRKERMQLLQKKEFESKKRDIEMERKNAEIISYFLPITNHI